MILAMLAVAGFVAAAYFHAQLRQCQRDIETLGNFVDREVELLSSLITREVKALRK